jgi:hypothetical protein
MSGMQTAAALPVINFKSLIPGRLKERAGAPAYGWINYAGNAG